MASRNGWEKDPQSKGGKYLQAMEFNDDSGRWAAGVIRHSPHEADDHRWQAAAIVAADLTEALTWIDACLGPQIYPTYDKNSPWCVDLTETFRTKDEAEGAYVCYLYDLAEGEEIA